MGIFGVDVSNHQASFNFQGWDFAILKASEGSTFKDGRFRQHLMNARAAGCIVAAYHYQRPDNYVYQADNIESMVPKDIPVIIDVEAGSGSFDITRNLVRELRNRGYIVPLSYIPRWYWSQVGSPSLEGLPALWASWYPDYVARPREQGIAKVPLSAWNSYGGLPVRMMQFTSTPHDMNWFPGTRDELYELLYGKAGSGGGGMPIMNAKEFWEYQIPHPVTNEMTPMWAFVAWGNIKGDDTRNLVTEIAADVEEIKADLADEEGGTGTVDLDAVADKAADKAVTKKIGRAHV